MRHCLYVYMLINKLHICRFLWFGCREWRGKGNCKCTWDVLPRGQFYCACVIWKKMWRGNSQAAGRARNRHTKLCRMRDIFGDTGIAKLRDGDEFDSKVIQLRQKYCTFQFDFGEYFDKLASKIRKHAVLPHAKHCDLPMSWINNNCESLNHCLLYTSPSPRD